MWLKFNDAQKTNLVKRNSLTKYKYFFFTSLCGELISLFKKILRISSYGHFAAITWSVNLDVIKMANYKSISTHIYHWPTQRSKTIHPKAFRLSISGMLFSAVSLFWSHNVAWIQFDFCSAQCHVTIPLKINMILKYHVSMG